MLTHILSWLLVQLVYMQMQHPMKFASMQLQTSNIKQKELSTADQELPTDGVIQPTYVPSCCLEWFLWTLVDHQQMWYESVWTHLKIHPSPQRQFRQNLIHISHSLMQTKTWECWMIPRRFLRLKILNGQIYEVKAHHAHRDDRTHIHTPLGQGQNRAAATDIPTSQVAHWLKI